MKKLKAYQLHDFLEFISLFISLVGSFASIIALISPEHSNLAKGAWLIVVGITMAAIFKFHKIRTISNLRLLIFAKNFHNISHTLRDHHARLCKRYKNDKRPLTTDELISNIENVCKEVVNSLSDLLNRSTGANVSVCIKYFWIDKQYKPFSFNEKEIDDLKVTTLCRCNNTYKKEKRNDRQHVALNTDLKLITNGANHFYCGDIVDYNKRAKEMNLEPYTDSNAYWKQVYKARITVPIRIDLSFTKQGFQKEKAYDLLGFITADSPSTSAFRKEEIEGYVDICKATADMLYRYLERFMYLWATLSKEPEKEIV